MTFIADRSFAFIINVIINNDKRLRGKEHIVSATVVGNPRFGAADGRRLR